MSRGAVAEINLAALSHNFSQLKSKVGDCKILAVVKSNAYGHGSLPVAKVLSQADGFGVATLEEALLMREAGIQKTILLFSGVQTQEELFVCVEHNISIVVHHVEQLAILRGFNLAAKSKLKVWLKIDTGMHRLGFASEKTQAIFQQLQALSCVENDIVLMTHLAQADDIKSEKTVEQLNTFSTAIMGLDQPVSIANSAAILAWPQTQIGWLRPGLMLYGASPFAHKTAQDFNLKSVMTLRAKLIAVLALKKGDAIGYGGTWQCPEDMPVGVAAIGYGDGYPRQVRQGTPILVNNQRCALVGRVSMDTLSIDLRNSPRARVGDAVVLWGAGLAVEEIAECASAIPYELLCGITDRVQKHYI